MLATNLFKIKFAYKGEDEDGGLKKKKLQIICQCVNYTDAEALAMKVMENDGMLKYEHEEPEIIRLKHSVDKLLLNDTMTTCSILVNKLSELYFQGDSDAIFIVKVNIFQDIDSGKGYTEEYMVPEKNGIAAINYVKKYLIHKGRSSNSFLILSHKIDETESIYMEPDLIEAKMKVDSEMEG